jgi:hypothetical protein
VLKFEDHGDMHKYVSNWGVIVGKFAYGSITNNWMFVLEENNHFYDWKARVRPNADYRHACPPHVVAFIDEHLALLNIAARLTS